MITISLCMIVKNEEETLERILSQAAPAMDEIIIVDTGSSDRTKEVAEKFTKNVFDFAWKDDFSAARNFAVSKATMEYWMWLDADDVLPPRELEKLLALKQTLDPSIDLVTARYLTGFSEGQTAALSYERERLMRTDRHFLWQGRVHEAISPAGNVFHSDLVIEHRKIRPGDPDRNLRIYESMLACGEMLSPRHLFYYGRELFDHRRYEEAQRVLESFLHKEDGWSEDKINTCLLLSQCACHLGQPDQAFSFLGESFHFGTPRPEIFCALGQLLLEENAYEAAIYWFLAALSAPEVAQSGFSFPDCREFFPCMQLCVCFDRLGDHKKAYAYHLRAQGQKPNDPAVKYNQKYFERLGIAPNPNT